MAFRRQYKNVATVGRWNILYIYEKSEDAFLWLLIIKPHLGNQVINVTIMELKEALIFEE